MLLKDEKGSLLFTLLVVIMFVSTAVFLSQLFFQERLHTQSTIQRIQQSYHEESIFDYLYFEVASLLEEKTFLDATQPLISPTDVTAIQTRLEHFLGEFPLPNRRYRTISSFTFDEPSFWLQDRCSNVNDCQLTLTFSVRLTEPSQTYQLVISDIHVKNSGTEEVPVYHVTTLLSKWSYHYLR